MRRTPVWTRWLALATLAAAALSLAACGGDTKPDGSLAVTWRVGGQTCDGAGLEWLDVELVDPREPTVPYDVARVRCEAGETIFSSVRPGDYDVQILGYPRTKTADGVQLTRADATYEGSAVGLRVRSSQEARVASSIVLTARKGAVYLNWKFSNGMLCAYNGVTTVEVIIYDEFSNPTEPMSFDCDLQTYRAGLPEEDADRALRGVFIDKLDAEPLSVEALGFDQDGNATHRGLEDFQVDHGEVRDLIVTLQPCAGACS